MGGDVDAMVTNLRCGGMALCTAINHCLADGVGSSQFLHAWAHFTARPSTDLSITAVHSRLALRPRFPPNIAFPHREFAAPPLRLDHPPPLDLAHFLQSQPLIPTSFTFTPSLILRLKQLCVPSLKSTSFEALASHVWRAWARAFGLPPAQKVKLLFSVNVRARLAPRLPEGYYGNGFVLACAETTARELVGANLRHGVRLVQEGKKSVSDGYVRSMVDLLEERRARPDLTASLVISQWAKMGLEELDFGEGRPVHMGPLASEIYCLFLPVVEEVDATRVLISMPESLVDKFEYCMWDLEEKEGGEDGGMNDFI
ncbi:hypothetical protein ACLOJK_001859 [Asimina triloba]